MTSRVINGKTECQGNESHSEKDLPRKGTRDRRQFENVSFLVGRIRHNRDAGRRFRNQPGGLRLRAGGRRRDENRRLTLRAFDSLAVKRFIAGEDFMTVRTFKFDRVHNAMVVWVHS